MATNKSASTFSPEEAFRLQAQWYSDLWDNVMSTIYWDLANDLWQYSGYANSTLWAYDKLLNFMAWNENKLQTVAWSLYKDLVGDINNQRDYVNEMFWPQWTLTEEIDTYYDDLWNYLATDAWRQAAKIAAQWMHSWASLWAIRAQQNEAYNESFWRYVQAKEQQINAKEKIASNLINFMSTLRQEYWDTTNQYIIEMYKRAYDLYNKVALSVASDLDSYNQLRASSWWSSSGSSILDSLWLIPRWDGTYTDTSWNTYTVDANWNLTLSSWWVVKWWGNASWSSLWRKHTDTSTAKWRLRMLNNELQKSDANGFVKALWNIWVAGSYILPNSFYEMIWA